MSSSVSESSPAKRLLAGLPLRAPGVHAVLLYGPRAEQLATLAQELANDWLCPKPVEGRACKDCPTCRAFAAGRAVDYQRIAPFGAANEIKLGAVTTDDDPDKDFMGTPLLQFFRTPPLMARGKVVWFETADRLNSRAANALLKTLEEAASSGRLILTTTEVGRVLPTIRSRCLCVPCPDDGGTDEAPEQSEAREAIATVLSAVETAPVGGALALSERFMAAAERLPAAKAGKRAGVAAALAIAADYALRAWPERPEAAKAIVEAHRLVLGYVGAGNVSDWLFCELLYRRG
ncbi:MAG: hypothetical protein KIT11_07825 [Fimbriimonadaceae bacterium]|nr:hypothetical protein [Fimbriimonadaceae bacterium]QYK56263.1 MAG: hypothetical protein KF733_02020 [Fimbriimonadaceae bacterium]